MLVEYLPTEEMWSEVLTKPLQVNSYRIMRSKLLNMPEIYVYKDYNETAKVIKAAGVSAKKKHVEFNQDVRMKYIPKIIGVKTKSVKLSIPAKKPNYSTSVHRSVLAKLQPDKGTEKRNGVHYEKGKDKINGRHYKK